MVAITFDKKRDIFDFNIESGEKHFALSVSDLLDLLEAYAPGAISEWVLT